MKTLKFKKLNIRAFKEKFDKTSKMFTIRDKLADTLKAPIRQIISLSHGRVSGLASRAKLSRDFLSLVVRLNKNHGADFTIKWLKACYVALQKALGQDKLKSLRDLEPGLPLPRLINGFPAVIPRGDRLRIREGERSVIVF